MKSVSFLIFTILLTTFTSCTRQYKVAKIIAGKTFIDEAVDILDEPQMVEKSAVKAGNSLYVWEDVTLQVNTQFVVTAIHKQPIEHETTLQFWKHHYKEIQTTFTKIQSSPSILWQFNIPSKGINVIYDERVDKVTKVIFYEAN